MRALASPEVLQLIIPELVDREFLRRARFKHASIHVCETCVLIRGRYSTGRLMLVVRQCRVYELWTLVGVGESWPLSSRRYSG